MEAILETIHSDKEKELKAFLDEERLGVIKCRDGITIKLMRSRDDTADIMIVNKDGKRPELGDAAWYFSDKAGYDIPCSVIREIANIHGGAVEIKEQEKSIFEKVLDGDKMTFHVTDGPEEESWER